MRSCELLRGWTLSGRYSDMAECDVLPFLTSIRDFRRGWFSFVLIFPWIRPGQSPFPQPRDGDSTDSVVRAVLLMRCPSYKWTAARLPRVDNMRVRIEVWDWIIDARVPLWTSNRWSIQLEMRRACPEKQAWGVDQVGNREIFSRACCGLPRVLHRGCYDT